jgi:hypothetical protein
MSSEHNPAAGKLDAWEVIKSVYALYKKYIVFVLLGGIILVGLSYLLRNSFEQLAFVATLITLTIQAILYVLFLRYISDRESGHKTPFSKVVQSSSKYLLPGIAIDVIVYVLFTAGLFLLIIPGLILGALFSQSFALVVLEGKGIKEALSLSRALTKGNLLNIFHAYWGTYFPVVALIVFSFLIFTGSEGMKSIYLSHTLTLFTSMIMPLLSFVVYRALKKLH